jgi:hypothetical protein
MTNADVAAAFMAQRPANTANLVSTGDRLLSYGWWECARWVNGVMIRRKGPSYSMTTAGKHRNQVTIGREATEETPVNDAEMRL